MITPINRIPLEGMTEGQMINAEVDAGQTFGSIESELTELLDHDRNDDSLSITLDWAMQIRDRTGHDWGTCISVAMTAFYG